MERTPTDLRRDGHLNGDRMDRLPEHYREDLPENHRLRPGLLDPAQARQSGKELGQKGGTAVASVVAYSTGVLGGFVRGLLLRE
ncbi:MAG: hypothetical protein ACK47B_27910 [Armatimonadota bacterium]